MADAQLAAQSSQQWLTDLSRNGPNFELGQYIIDYNRFVSQRARAPSTSYFMLHFIFF